MGQYRDDISNSEICELRDQGLTLQEVADRLRCSPYTVYVREINERHYRAGHPAPRPNPANLDDALSWAELHRKYGSLRAVAVAVGRSHEYVRRQLISERGT